MRSKDIWILAVAAIFVVAASDRILAARPKQQVTTIYVDNMHCKACAKKIARKLYAVPGVVAVHADVGKNRTVVTPQKEKSLSPKTLWEAVQAAKFKPVKLIGPHGTFSQKPTR